MTSAFEPKVVPAGESAGQFDAACNHVRNMTQARCAAVIEVDPQKRTPILLKRRCRNGQASYPVPGGIPGANG
jgi:hypothetical protein